MQYCFLFNINETWQKVLYVACLTQSLMVLTEPPTNASFQMWAIGVELFCIAVSDWCMASSGRDGI